MSLCVPAEFTLPGSLGREFVGAEVEVGADRTGRLVQWLEQQP